jgi:hypothetical protein
MVVINGAQQEVERLRGMGITQSLRTDGIANLDVRKAIGAYVPPDASIPPQHRSGYPIHGVWADSRAFLNPPEAHSFEKATDQFRDEFIRLYRGMVGVEVWLLGYSTAEYRSASASTHYRPNGASTWWA